MNSTRITGSNTTVITTLTDEYTPPVPDSAAAKRYYLLSGVLFTLGLQELQLFDHLGSGEVILAKENFQQARLLRITIACFLHIEELFRLLVGEIK